MFLEGFSWGFIPNSRFWNTSLGSSRNYVVETKPLYSTVMTAPFEIEPKVTKIPIQHAWTVSQDHVFTYKAAIMRPLDMGVFKCGIGVWADSHVILYENLR